VLGSPAVRELSRGGRVKILVQAIVLIIAGFLVMAVSILADAIGIGANPVVIGWKQYSGAAVGLVLVLFGAHLGLHHSGGDR
jgi:hypothetical protein